MYVYHQEKQDKSVTLLEEKNVDEALAILKFTPRGAAEIIAKVVKSAKANAENNHEMDADKLCCINSCKPRTYNEEIHA